MRDGHDTDGARLRASRARLLAAADGTRHDIERALHDGIQQDLVALAVKLQLARLAIGSDPSRAQELFDELERDVRDALDGVRMLSETVYPSSLETRGLREALLGAAAVAGVSARIDAVGLNRYPPHIERAVYFCCREALKQEAEVIRIWEEDDALWFELTGATGVLTELEDRVDTLGGRVSADGAVVRATIPLS